ncbi:hypothetical protein CSA37_07555 [Candidatus Fermentibacteria bacterium]|nr:MAG: hypothetical protein CSA37_07555 [Candidatus Fermentibacteria bacterium]
MSKKPVSGFMKEIARHTSIFGMSNLLRQGLGLILLPVYLSLIPTAEYGVLSMLMIAANLLSLLSSSTLAPALFRSYYDYNTKEEQRTVITTALVFTTVLASAAIIASTFFLKPISLLLTGEGSYEKLVLMVLVSAGVRAVNTITMTVYRVKKWSGKYALLSVITMIISMLTVIYLVVIRKMGIQGIITGNMIGAVAGTSLSLYFIRGELCTRISFPEIRKMYLFGYPHIPENVTAFALNSGTRMILRIICGSEGVGIYALGKRIGSLIEKLVITPLTMIAPASIMSVEKDENPERYYSALARYYFIITGYAALFLSLMTKPFLVLFSKQGYFDAWRVVPFISLAIAVYGGRGLTSVGLMLKRKTIWYPIAYAFGALTSLGLMVLLTERFGPSGTAISILAGNLMVVYIRHRAAARYMNVPIPWESILRAFLVYLFVGVPGCLLSTGYPLLDGAVLLSAGLLLVPFLLTKTGVLSREEMNSFRNIVADKLKSLPRDAGNFFKAVKR